MSYKTTEKKFYEKHYGGGIVTSDSSLDYKKVEKDYFSIGARYWLVDQILPLIMRRGSLVELGCGSGETLIFLANKYAFDKSIGIDIAIQGQISVESSRQISFLSANCNEALPFENDSVDLLIAMMVIEHLFDPFHSFSEIKRVLSNGGLAVINLPLVTGLQNRIRLLMGQLPITSVSYGRWLTDKEWDGNHLHYFSVDSIRDLAMASGLEIVKISAVGRFTLIKKLFPKLLASELTFAVRKK